MAWLRFQRLRIVYNLIMKQFFLKGKERGQTLIEALVALGAAVVVLSAITVAVISALNNVEYSKNQNLATQYAQQGLEIMRHLSDTNWSVFSAKISSTYCLAKDSNLLSDYLNSCAQNVDIFAREVDITQSSPTCFGSSSSSDSVLVKVKVSWTDGKCNVGNANCHNVILESCFSNHNTNLVTP